MVYLQVNVTISGYCQRRMLSYSYRNIESIAVILDICQNLVHLQKKGTKTVVMLQYKTLLTCVCIIYDLLHLGNCSGRNFSLCTRAKRSDPD